MNDDAVYRTAPATSGLLIIIFDKVKYSIRYFKMCVEQFSLSNGNTDRQVITLCYTNVVILLLVNRPGVAGDVLQTAS